MLIPFSERQVHASHRVEDMNTPMIQVIPIVSMPFDENSYLVFVEGQRDAAVIDPGLEPAKIMRKVKQHDLTIVAILNTHGHADHIAGNELMKKQFPAAPLLIGEVDAPMLSDSTLNLSAPFGMSIISPPADRLLHEGDELTLAGIHWKVREIPGHSPGHMVFIVQSANQLIVFGGDTLFQGGIGRTDFPGGSLEQLLHGIRNKLFTLPDDTIVLPGHGDATTVGEEKRSNPYVN